MSNEVSAIAKKRVVGSPIVKSVLMYMADAASNDGSGIWTSKKNMALDLEMTKRSVQRSILELISMGIVVETGKQKCKNGFTIEYLIKIDALEILKSTRDVKAPQNKKLITGQKRTKIMEAYKYRCVFCSAHKNLTIDHIHPVSRGGGHGVKNLQVLCKSCNSKKGTKSQKEFFGGAK